MLVWLVILNLCSHDTEVVTGLAPVLVMYFDRQAFITVILFLTLPTSFLTSSTNVRVFIFVFHAFCLHSFVGFVLEKLEKFVLTVSQSTLIHPISAP